MVGKLTKVGGPVSELHLHQRCMFFRDSMGTPWITLSCLYHVKGQEGRKLGNPFEGSSKLESGFTQNVQGGNLMRTTQGEHENCVTSSMME